MKKINNYWVDENNNKWDCNFNTEEQAENKSKSLTNCYYCSNCSDCSDCSDFKTNPQRYYTSNIGSRNSQTKFYWTTKDEILVICGCFKGDLKEFSNRVKETYPDKNNKYRQQYDSAIRKVRYLLRG